MLGSFRDQTQVVYAIPQGLAKVDWKTQGLDEVEVLLTLSGSPFLRMSKGLRYLLQYPYGCVEQTSSAIMPLAALRGLINQGLVPGIEAKETDAYLNKGVQPAVAHADRQRRAGLLARVHGSASLGQRIRWLRPFNGPGQRNQGGPGQDEEIDESTSSPPSTRAHGPRSTWPWPPMSWP